MPNFRSAAELCSVLYFQIPPIHAYIERQSADILSRELLCHSSRDIYLKFGLTRGAVHQKAKVYLELDLPKLKPDKSPLVLQICAESRKYAQGQGHLWFYHEKLAPATSLSDSLQFSGTFLNINLDRFIIDCDFKVHPAKPTEFLLQGLKGFKNIELWYDRLDRTLDCTMVSHILAEKPDLLVVKEIVDAGNTRHPRYCYCSLCVKPEEGERHKLLSRQEVDYYISIGISIRILEESLHDLNLPLLPMGTDMRVARYKYEVEECQQKLFDCLTADWDCDERTAASVIRQIRFKRGSVSEIDWYARTRTRYGGSGMI